MDGESESEREGEDRDSSDEFRGGSERVEKRGERGAVSRIEALLSARPARKEQEVGRSSDDGSGCAEEWSFASASENVRRANGSIEKLPRGRTAGKKGTTSSVRGADNPVWQALLPDEEARASSSQVASEGNAARAQRMQMRCEDAGDDSRAPRTSPRQILHCGQIGRTEGQPDCTRASPCPVSPVVLSCIPAGQGLR